MLYARTNVMIRRRKVTSLLVRGITPTEIAEILQEHRHTIYNDLRVIRSGKYDALREYTRSCIVCQLYLNAQERARFLWHLAENAQKEYVKVMALRELRLNDERIVSKLPDIQDTENPEVQEDDIEKEEMMKVLVSLKERVECLQWHSHVI